MLEHGLALTFWQSYPFWRHQDEDIHTPWLPYHVWWHQNAEIHAPWLSCPFSWSQHRNSSPDRARASRKGEMPCRWRQDKTRHHQIFWFSSTLNDSPRQSAYILERRSQTMKTIHEHALRPFSMSHSAALCNFRSRSSQADFADTEYQTSTNLTRICYVLRSSKRSEVAINHPWIMLCGKVVIDFSLENKTTSQFSVSTSVPQN